VPAPEAVARARVAVAAVVRAGAEAVAAGNRVARPPGGSRFNRKKGDKICHQEIEEDRKATAP